LNVYEASIARGQAEKLCKDSNMMKRNFDELRSIPIPLIELHVFRVCFYSVLIYNLFV